MSIISHHWLVCSSFLLLSLTHCAGAPANLQLVTECREGLNSAFQELDEATIQGLGGTVSWTKAATLLSTAKIQQQFDKYPNCIDKVQRARFYLQESQKT